MPGKTFKVLTRNQTKLKQLNWFFKKYSEIFYDQESYLYFIDPIYCDEGEEFLKTKVRGIVNCCEDSLNTLKIMPSIKYLELFDRIYLPLSRIDLNKDKNIILRNIDKISNKNKLILSVNSKIISSMELLEKLIKILNFFGITNISFYNSNSFYSDNFNSINKMLQGAGISIVEPLPSFSYIIDDLGNLISVKTEKPVSSIYKMPGFLLFS